MTSTAHLSMPRMAWIYEGTFDSIGLDQFATTVAAMAHHETSPAQILETVLASIAENLNAASGRTDHDAESVLREKAHALGFNDMTCFLHEVNSRIATSIVDLQISKLSSNYRPARHAS